MADHMIMSYREKADRWVRQAQMAQRRMYTDSVVLRYKYQDASCYQEQAAQCFRVAKRFQDAGVAYKSSGRMEEKLKRPEVAASFYHEAALCFSKEDPQEAATCYLTAINLYCQIWRFSTAARLELEVAELMEKDRNQSLAVVHFLKAAGLYLVNSCYDVAADRCHLNAARSLGMSGRYMEAADLYEEVGHRMMSSDLLKFNSPETFLRAILCLVCASGRPEATALPYKKNEPEARPPRPRPTPKSIKLKLSSMGKASAIFQDSRECAFGSDVARAAKEGDLDLYATSVYAYDNVCGLDSWCLRVLKVICNDVEQLSIKLKKIRATQEKLRRRQAAVERARGRLKQPDDEIPSGDSDKEESMDSSTLEARPDETASKSASSGSNFSASSPNSTSSSGDSSASSGSSSASSSDSESTGGPSGIMSGHASSSDSAPSSFSSADVTSPSESGSEGEAEKDGSRPVSGDGSRSRQRSEEISVDSEDSDDSGLERRKNNKNSTAHSKRSARESEMGDAISGSSAPSKLSVPTAKGKSKRKSGRVSGENSRREIGTSSSQGSTTLGKY